MMECENKAFKLAVCRLNQRILLNLNKRIDTIGKSETIFHIDKSEVRLNFVGSML